MNWRSDVDRPIRESVRVYFAPLRGAIRAIREELDRPIPESSLNQGFSLTALRDEFRVAAQHAPRRYFAPLVGAIDAILAEIKRP
jgi:hypothetical protein